MPSQLQGRGRRRILGPSSVIFGRAGVKIAILEVFWSWQPKKTCCQNIILHCGFVFGPISMKFYTNSPTYTSVHWLNFHSIRTIGSGVRRKSMNRLVLFCTPFNWSLDGFNSDNPTIFSYSSVCMICYKMLKILFVRG